MQPIHRILSIQSHVVHGYVGNRSATFPLQCQGWDVDVINTVNFSNHTGYGSVRGTKTTATDLQEIYQGLKDIDVHYDALLTGYVPGADSLEVVCEIGYDIKQRNPGLLWLLDPVMGDEGELYVSESVIPVYKKILLRGGVDIITPNQFEAELIVDFSIVDEESLRRALKELHIKYKVPNVTISSLTIGNKLVAAASIYKNGEITSSLFEIAYIESYFTGVGDLFSALLIDRVYRLSVEEHDPKFLEDAVNEVLSVMSHVLRVTSEASTKAHGGSVTSKMGDPGTMKACELRLIECKDVYSSTEKRFEPWRV